MLGSGQLFAQVAREAYRESWSSRAVMLRGLPVIGRVLCF